MRKSWMADHGIDKVETTVTRYDTNQGRNMLALELSVADRVIVRFLHSPGNSLTEQVILAPHRHLALRVRAEGHSASTTSVPYRRSPSLLPLHHLYHRNATSLAIYRRPIPLSPLLDRPDLQPRPRRLRPSVNPPRRYKHRGIRRAGRPTFRSTLFHRHFRSASPGPGRRSISHPPNLRHHVRFPFRVLPQTPRLRSREGFVSRG